MATNRKNELRVVFWHNDFPDGSRQHNWYGKTGPMAARIRKIIKPGICLKWHFHGGFIHPGRVALLRRLEQADVFISAYPWNMDMDDEKMHFDKAESGFLEILQEIKKKNKNLKIFFLQEPHYLEAELQELGEFASDLHDEIIYDYFLNR